MAGGFTSRQHFRPTGHNLSNSDIPVARSVRRLSKGPNRIRWPVLPVFVLNLSFLLILVSFLVYLRPRLATWHRPPVTPRTEHTGSVKPESQSIDYDANGRDLNLNSASTTTQSQGATLSDDNPNVRVQTNTGEIKFETLDASAKTVRSDDLGSLLETIANAAPIGGGERQLQEVASAAQADVSPPGMPGWKPIVPTVLLRKGLAYEGDLLRMDRFLHKVVVERKPVTVVAMGSSVTSEFGGRKGPQLKLLNLDDFEFHRVVNPDGWISSALDTLVRAYPPIENKRWTDETTGKPYEEPYWLINLGIGAVGPGPWASCLGKTYFSQLPKDVDLVIVEWALAVNDREFLSSLDSVLQILLHTWDPPPAIFFANFFFWCRANLWCRGGFVTDPVTGEEKPLPVEQQNLTWSNIGVFSFQSYDARGTGDVSEDNITVLAQYYGLPSISMRNAFFHLAAQTHKGYWLHDQIGYHDMGLHPSPALARGRYADVIVEFFRRAIQGLEERRMLAAIEQSEEIISALLKLPAPFFQRWYPDAYGRNRVQTQSCYTYETLLGVTPPIRRSQGYAFSKDPDSKLPKPGLATWENGSFVEFELSTIADPKIVSFDTPDLLARAQALIEIRYLVSYERMGAVDLSCVEGCSCEPHSIDATITEHWSVPAPFEFPVSQSKHCVLRLVTRQSPNGSKFKILSITVKFQPQDEGVEAVGASQVKRRRRRTS
eukprot:TRINITY_DN22181_c0_g1_i1.p1 TRINITY_DN22181_c0_g1~~TRINITY_DN22181_c0_g1_i1.p1  ORF type:complete len:716 (-),score=53.44 TRINITY_DN22181_c0_g1_i1:424-2571(-)